MESGASPNVDTLKFLTLDESEATTTNAKWNCSCDFALKMLETGVHVDITFNAKGGSVKAHKCVLACVSPTFNGMFRYNMEVRSLSTSIVDFTDMTIDAVQLFLLMLYTSNGVGNEKIHPSSVQMPHFHAAIDKHFYEIYGTMLVNGMESRFGSVLISALARNLTPENCWFYYDYSLVGDSSPFVESAFSVCKDYILGNYHDIIGSPGFIGAMIGGNCRRVQRVIIRAES